MISNLILNLFENFVSRSHKECLRNAYKTMGPQGLKSSLTHIKKSFNMCNKRLKTTECQKTNSSSKTDKLQK